MRYIVVTADYRPNNEKKPTYCYHTEMGAAWVWSWFERTYPWLKVYDAREVPEKDLSEGQRKWAQRL